MGATLGAAYGQIVTTLVPDINISVPTFAIAGMAAIVGSSTGAVFTSVVMIAELTGNHNIVLLVILTVSISYVVRRIVSPPSIYTLKLNRRGHTVPEGREASVTAAHVAQDLMTNNFQIVATSDESIRTAPGVVIRTDEDGRIVSVSQQFKAKDKPSQSAVAENVNFVLVEPNANQIEVLREISQEQGEIVLVSSAPADRLGKDVLGVVTLAELLMTVKDVAKLS